MFVYLMLFKAFIDCVAKLDEKLLYSDYFFFLMFTVKTLYLVRGMNGTSF